MTQSRDLRQTLALERMTAVGHSFFCFLQKLPFMKKIILSLAVACAALAVVSCSDENIAPQSDQATHEDFKTSTEAFAEGSVVDYTYEALSNGTVKLTFVNTTGGTMTGDLIREGVSYIQNGTIITYFSVAPGETYTYIDDNVVPNETYRYIFEYFVGDMSDYHLFFDEVTVTSTVPALGNFTLIAAAYDDEYEVLTDGYTIVLEGTNIRIEANADLTQSVQFFLNGEKFKDNSAPFALYGDKDGDYHMGELENGSYTLTAIAYPEKNGKGVPGDTATVSFEVNNLYQQ
jgi:hypothetical protein